MSKKKLIILNLILIGLLIFPIVYLSIVIDRTILFWKYSQDFQEFVSQGWLRELIFAIISAIIIIGVIITILVITFKSDISTLFSSTIGEKLTKSRECKRQRQLEKARKKLQDLEKKDS